jgi:hypothetical protein
MSRSATKCLPLCYSDTSFGSSEYIAVGSNPLLFRVFRAFIEFSRQRIESRSAHLGMYGASAKFHKSLFSFRYTKSLQFPKRHRYNVRFSCLDGAAVQGPMKTFAAADSVPAFHFVYGAKTAPTVCYVPEMSSVFVTSYSPHTAPSLFVSGLNLLQMPAIFVFAPALAIPLVLVAVVSYYNYRTES